MFGYNIVVKQINREIEDAFDLIRADDRTEEDLAEYRGLQLAHWDAPGYPNWPEELVVQNLATVVHNNVLNSTFFCPLKYILPHISYDMKHEGPAVIQDNGITEPGDLIRPTIYNDRIALCDLEEIVQIDRWDMS
jgi:hypothetical protein